MERGRGMLDLPGPSEKRVDGTMVSEKRDEREMRRQKVERE